MNRRQSWNIITVFLLLVFGFSLATMLKPARDFSERENRPLQKMPSVSLKTVFSGEFEKDYEEYLTDQFVWRDKWISVKTTADRLAGRQESNDVYFAKDDYLIEKHTGVFTSDLASANISFLQNFIQKAAETYGKDHVTAMIIPNAVDILREKLPAHASPYDEEIYLSRIREALPAECVFDASPVLKQHSEEEIYYRTDHHWETLGAFYVWQDWCRKKGYGEPSLDSYEIRTVSDHFEGTIAAKTGGKIHPDTIEIFRPLQENRVELVYNRSDDFRSTMYQESALDRRDQYAVFFGGNYGLIEITSDIPSDRSLLVIKDSYAHCFAPFLTETFRQTDLLDLRYFNQSLSEFMKEKNYTDVLFLYNASGFAEDTALAKLTM